MPVNYATQYQQALAQRFPDQLRFNALYNVENDSRYRWTGARTIEIPVLSTTGRVDANTEAITPFSRNVSNQWEPKTLRNHRAWDTLLAPTDVIQTNYVLTIQNATKVYNEEQKFAEMDSYLASTVYSDWIALGKTANTTALTEANILQVFDRATEGMDEANVPESGRILYITPATNTILKSAAALARSMNVDEGIRKEINRIVAKLDEVDIVKVPSKLMKTVYNFSVGAVPGVGAQQINMFLVHPAAIITPLQYEFAGMEEPSAHSKGKYLYYEESNEDVFILNERADAIWFNVTE